MTAAQAPLCRRQKSNGDVSGLCLVPSPLQPLSYLFSDFMDSFLESDIYDTVNIRWDFKLPLR